MHGHTDTHTLTHTTTHSNISRCWHALWQTNKQIYAHKQTSTHRSKYTNLQGVGEARRRGGAGKRGEKKISWGEVTKKRRTSDNHVRARRCTHLWIHSPSLLNTHQQIQVRAPVHARAHAHTWRMAFFSFDWLLKAKAPQQKLSLEHSLKRIRMSWAMKKNPQKHTLRRKQRTDRC